MTWRVARASASEPCARMPRQSKPVSQKDPCAEPSPSHPHLRLGQGKGRWSRASIDPLSGLVLSADRRVNVAIGERGLRRSAARNYSICYSLSVTACPTSGAMVAGRRRHVSWAPKRDAPASVRRLRLSAGRGREPTSRAQWRLASFLCRAPRPRAPWRPGWRGAPPRLSGHRRRRPARASRAPPRTPAFPGCRWRR